MSFVEILKLLKDQFTYPIPLGVVLIVIIIIILVFSFLFKQIKVGFETQVNELRKTHNALINDYKEKSKQQYYRINQLEKILDSKLKGGKKKWM